jgi:hypothetical protein
VWPPPCSTHCWRWSTVRCDAIASHRGSVLFCMPNRNPLSYSACQIGPAISYRFQSMPSLPGILRLRPVAEPPPAVIHGRQGAGVPRRLSVSLGIWGQGRRGVCLSVWASGGRGAEVSVCQSGRQGPGVPRRLSVSLGVRGQGCRGVCKSGCHDASTPCQTQLFLCEKRKV